MGEIEFRLKAYKNDGELAIKQDTDRPVYAEVSVTGSDGTTVTVKIEVANLKKALKILK